MLLSCHNTTQHHNPKDLDLRLLFNFEIHQVKANADTADEIYKCIIRLLSSNEILNRMPMISIVSHHVCLQNTKNAHC
jgi:hypothetical protein